MKMENQADRRLGRTQLGMRQAAQVFAILRVSDNHKVPVCWFAGLSKF